MSIVIGIFFILHGLVHFLYFGHSARFFKLQPHMQWPDNSWLFAPFFGKKAVRAFAGNFCILAGVGFIVSAIAVFAQQGNWYFLAVGSAVFSSFLYLVFWNGKYEKLNDQGAIAIAINFFITIGILFFHWPKLNF
ncbi:hypothetical protein [Maribellus maritimus]|uniref:hypothetical protein n=1 Tax=Maribellus maritimus TaxID=2870838 RepID=UPI001EEB170B|nr:hypothetical protein [Maribellus maritimus]MCG6188395.1 hypothetical protein [Maribellus maritimus]